MHQKESVIQKTFNPRKKLIATQFYSMNSSDTKQIHLGLDIENSFQPVIYLTKQSSLKNSGVYLNLDTFKELMTPQNVDSIRYYFSPTEMEKTKSETLLINQRIKIHFREFYDQKSIVISNAVEYENIYTDMIILQDRSWHNLRRMSNCVIKAMEILKNYSKHYKIAYDYLFKIKFDACLKTLNLKDVGNLEANIKSIYFKNNFDPTDDELLSFYPTDITIASKIFLEVKMFCAESIINDIIYNCHY